MQNNLLTVKEKNVKLPAVYQGKAMYLLFPLTILDSPKVLEGYTPSNLYL